MTGVDTNVLVCLAFQNHVGNSAARTALENELQAGHQLAITGPIISEFLHVVTDSRRFPDPLTMDEALVWITQFINRPVVSLLPSDDQAARLALQWIHQFRLGRKRLFDTNFAATLRIANCKRIVTFNAADFQNFGGFDLIVPQL